MLDLREKMAIENEKLSYENALLTEDIENNEFVIRKLNENEDSLKKTLSEMESHISRLKVGIRLKIHFLLSMQLNSIS